MSREKNRFLSLDALPKDLIKIGAGFPDNIKMLSSSDYVIPSEKGSTEINEKYWRITCLVSKPKDPNFIDNLITKLLRKKNNKAIELLDHNLLKNWVDSDKLKSDSKKEEIIKSQVVHAIKSINDWGKWANTDERKIQILKSKCSFAIQKIKN